MPSHEVTGEVIGPSDTTIVGPQIAAQAWSSEEPPTEPEQTEHEHGWSLTYVTSCLRQLATINSEIRVDEPFRPGTPREPWTRARPDDTAREAKCPSCHVVHAGECL